MTTKARNFLRLWPLALALGVPAAACAWQAQTLRPASPPRPVVVVQPPANLRFQQTMREHQMRDQLQKSQLEEQLRQSQANAIRRPYATDAVQAVRLDRADQAQRELYRARQQDLLDRYQSAVVPPVVHSSEPPAPAHSAKGLP